MPFSELPLGYLVILFLVVFSLVMIYPSVKRGLTSLRRQLRTAAQSKQPFAGLLKHLPAEPPAKPPPPGPLNDYEIIVLRRLAQARGKALSHRQVNAPLLFGKETLHRTLRSLNHRRLVDMKLSPLLVQRFTLSEAGRRYAIEQDYIVHTQRG